MSLFRRKTEVVRRGTSTGSVEERTTRRVRGRKVEVRRVKQPAESPAPRQERRSKAQKKPRPRPAPRPEPEEIIVPPETERKQMLVRVLPHQTQIVVLEGPVLVEHYVARSENKSLVGSVYLGKTRSVLPGMEASFVDFGASKNGVLYVGDLQKDPARKGKVRIEEVLSKGDEVLVQVVKDAMGHKGARLTNQISVAGRYLVFVPDSDAHGISRRLPEEERDRLRNIIRDIRPEGAGVIVRTAAKGATRAQLRADLAKLVEAWDGVKAEAARGGAPRLIHEEPALLIRVIREHFTPEFRRLLIDDPDAKEQVERYLSETESNLISRVHLYEDEMPLFERFHVEDQLRKALDRKVWLPSGGHLVLDRTEALTVIDVNTGRFVGSSSLEDTVLQNNLEAAEEIGRQLRLRDIGGIIVIDFIDMEIAENQRAVLRRLKETLAKDKTRTQVFDVSNLGLVEMTRKNVSEGLVESFSDVCSCCGGRGVILHEEAATIGLPLDVEDWQDGGNE
jgi:ribonuclease E